MQGHLPRAAGAVPSPLLVQCIHQERDAVNNERVDPRYGWIDPEFATARVGKMRSATSDVTQPMLVADHLRQRLRLLDPLVDLLFGWHSRSDSFGVVYLLELRLQA